MRVIRSATYVLTVLPVVVLAACGGGGSSPNDACAGVTCDAPAASCDGEVAVTYSGSGVCDPTDGKCSYANVEVRTSCSDQGLTCSDGACVDPCNGVTCDTPPAATCEGDTLTSYASTGTCDASTLQCTYAETQTDCTQGGQLCSDGACVDPCSVLTCDTPPAATCDGDTVVSYAAAGTCDTSTQACTYPEDTRTDCTQSGQICRDGACVDPGLCYQKVCDTPPAPICDGSSVVTYADAGTCAVDTGVCDYPEASRTDCSATGQLCSDGACTSALVVSEIMFQTAIPESDGEWFEIHDIGPTAIDLSGYTFKDDGTDSFTIPESSGLVIQPDGYLVFGRNANTNANGGVQLDYAYGEAMTLANDGDQIVIVAPDGTELDRVAYTADSAWPMPFGASLQFDAAATPSAAADDDPADWCPSKTVYDTTSLEHGTPGAPNETCDFTPLTTTIQDLQDQSSAQHPPQQTLVRIENDALIYIDPTGGWVEDPATGPYSGIHFVLNGVSRANIFRHHVVNIEGYYEEYYGAAQIKVTKFVDTGTTFHVPPTVVSTSLLADPVQAEPYDGMLIQVNDVAITSNELLGGAGDLGTDEQEFMLDGRIRVNDYIAYTLPTHEGGVGIHPFAECQVYDTMVGLLNLNHRLYKIYPREPSDLGTMTLATDSSAVTASSTAISPAAVCVGPGSTVTFSAAGANDVGLSSYDPSDGTVTGAPLDLTVPGGGSTTYTFAIEGGYPYLVTSNTAVNGIVVVHR